MVRTNTNNSELERLSGMQTWEWPNNAVETIRAGLRNEDANVRNLAADLAGYIQDTGLATDLLELVTSDADIDLRAAAAIALGPVLELCDAADYLDLFEEPEVSLVCFEKTLRAFRHLYHDAATPKLLRRRLLEAAVRAPRSWQEGATRAAYHSSDDTDWQITSVFAMGYLGGFETEITEALEHPSEKVRLEAVRACASQDLIETGAQIMALAKSDETPAEIRLAAINTLAHIRPPGTSDLLSALSTAPNGEVAGAARDALDEARLWEEFDEGEFAEFDAMLMDEEI